MKKLILVMISFGITTIAQPWNYNFGSSTGVFNTANTASESFLPNPESGGGSESRVRIGSGGGSFNLENQSISFGTNSYLRSVAPTSTSYNKFQIYNFTAGKKFTIQFHLRLGASDGSSSGAEDGNWHFFIGDGNTFSNDAAGTTSETFTALRWSFGMNGTITTEYRNSSGNWVVSGLSGTPFAQGFNYKVEMYCNNSTSSVDYTYGSSQSVASNKFDLWVNGSLVGNDLSKSGLIDDSNIDSWMFYGSNSTFNVANIFIDEIIYTNDISSTPLPVELTSFTANVSKNKVDLNWTTATEINNYGFEILRADLKNNWQKIGFVNGHGNCNSEK
ncbi:MAG: hypothetical protein FJW56_09810, partial [Actinobacteria bacterium]|nr:hypothetical protein [Actinomycetota bacterium]